MKIRVEVKNTMRNVSETRLPTQSELVKKLKDYASGNKGLVLYHKSFYDYHYDTKLNNYHTVDSIATIGDVIDVVATGDKVFIVVDCREDAIFDPDERYICFYRAVMESGTNSKSRRLKFTNLFAVDIIHINEDEVTDKMEFSTVELITA